MLALFDGLEGCSSTMGGQQQRFLPFLPTDGDAASLDGEAAEALHAINDDLGWLLTTDAAEFWAVARTDPSLPQLVDTFLRYARRPFDDGFQDLTPLELSVWHRMLALLHRLFAATEARGPSKRDRNTVLQAYMSVPKLLDTCAVYGAAGSSQLSEVAAAALELLPRLSDDLEQAAAAIADNVRQVVDACLAAAAAAGRDPGMGQSLRDGVTYLRDTCLTLCALLRAYPAAALLLMGPGAALVEALGSVHDHLVPAAMFPAAHQGVAVPQSAHVELASEKLVQLLLVHSYLQLPQAQLVPRGSSGRGAGGGSSAAGARGSPVARGEALLNAVMQLGHREEESASGGAAGVGLSLAQALAERHGLAGSIQQAVQQGYISLDEAQLDYLAALLGLSSLSGGPTPVPGAGGRGGAGGVPGAGPALKPAMDTALLKSQIEQVKELLPDYGDGFVAACLQACGGSAEGALNALLEGALPAAVAQLDQQLTLQAYLQQQQSADGDDAAAAARRKGKAPLEEEPLESWPGLPGQLPGFGGADAAPLGAASVAAAVPASRPKTDSLTSKYLNVREQSYRETLRAAATSMQYEYDDEYDDAMDDLVTFGADGLTEAEGEEAREGGSAGGLSLGALQRSMQGLGMQAGAPPFQPGRGAAHPQQQQQRQQRGKGSKLWVLDGRIYQYAKPGAREVCSQAEADAVLAEAQAATREIHGLGAGGNVPLPSRQQQQHWRQQQGEGEEGAGASAGGGMGRGRGRGRGDGAPGDGGRGGEGGRGHRTSEQLQHRRKDQNKASVGNHHRKDRALAKQGRGAAF